MASGYTTNYGLCQWQGADAFLREEFNQDNAKIDGALAAIQSAVAQEAAQRQQAVTAEAQARQALDNLGAVLKAGGMDFCDVTKTTVFLADINDFAAINAIYAEYFTGEAPARSCVQVAALPKGALFEIEAVAVK